MCPLVRKQWWLILFCLPLYSMERVVAPKEIEQASPLCAVPDNVLSIIGSYLHSWKDICALRATCNNLDRRVSVPGKKIILDLHAKMDTANSDPDIIMDPPEMALSKAVEWMHNAVAKNGRNPIVLDLNCNNLGHCPAELSKFISACCLPPIVDKIRELSLACNNITHLPREITGLTHLKYLSLKGNTVDQESLRRVSQMQSLTHLDTSWNQLIEFPGEISQLQGLKKLDIDSNKLSLDVLNPLFLLKNLTHLDITANPLVYREFLKLLQQGTWPRLKKVWAYGLCMAQADFNLPKPDCVFR